MGGDFYRIGRNNISILWQKIDLSFRGSNDLVIGCQLSSKTSDNSSDVAKHKLN